MCKMLVHVNIKSEWIKLLDVLNTQNEFTVEFNLCGWTISLMNKSE